MEFKVENYENKKGDSKQFSVFIVDDEDDARMLIQLALSDLDIKLSVFENGLAAQEAMDLSFPDLLLLDVQMPGISGIELCQWIKQRTKRVFVPVILLTSQSELDDKVHGLNCGADDYITKPFQVPELEARVRAMLRIKTLTDELHEVKNELQEKERQLVAMQVAGAAAHELGQPLTSILLNTQLIQSEAENLPGLSDAIKDIHAQCSRMKDIIQKLNKVKNYRTKNYTEGLEILDLE